MHSDELKFRELIEVVKALRGINGCPWDKKQTIISLKKYLHEEFNELLMAIDNNDPENLCEEAGDLLFLIVMISQISSESKLFGISDVLSSICEKLVRRHPHVFAGTEVANEEDLRRQWEMIKKQEKSKKN